MERYNFGFSLVKIQAISGLQATLGLGCDGTDRKIFKLYVLILTHVMKNNVNMHHPKMLTLPILEKRCGNWLLHRAGHPVRNIDHGQVEVTDPNIKKLIF